MSDWEMVFADDEREANPTSFKFLQMAHAWKSAQAKKTGAPTTGLLSGFTMATETNSATNGVHTSGTEEKTEDVNMERNGDATSDVASSDGE